MLLFRLNYGEPGEINAIPLQTMEKQLIKMYTEFKQNDGESREALYKSVLAYYNKAIKDGTATAKDAAFCWKIFDWLGKTDDRTKVGAAFSGAVFEAEKVHYGHMFAVLDNATVTKANGTHYFFFNEKGVALMTKTMDDLYAYSKKKMSDDWQTGSFKKNLNVSYNTEEDAGYFREICARLPFLSAAIDETGDKKIAKVSLEYDENNSPKTKSEIAPTPEQYVKTNPPQIDADVKSEETSTRKEKRSTITKTSETGEMLERDKENADIRFVDENRNNGINSASNSRQVTVQSLVDRYLAVNYKHRLPSLELLKSSLNAALRQIASDMGYKGEDAIEQFVYNNLDAFVVSVKELVASGKLKIRSTATVEKVYGGGMSWNEVKAELELNLGKVADNYGEALNQYFNSILGAALTKRMNAGLNTSYNGEEINIPIVTDLGLVQEIPESIRNKWLEDPSTSSALKYFLKNSYSDERVRENRLNIFSTIYYDAVAGDEDAIHAMSHLNGVLTFKDSEGNTLNYTENPESIITDVSLNTSKKALGQMNQCISLKSKVLRWADKTTGESSYFDQMLQMGDFGIAHANSHGIYPKETYNRALGFSLDKAETLDVKFVDSPKKMELNTEYTVRVKAKQNDGVPDGGKIVIKVDLGGEQTELTATDEGNGIYSAKFTPTKSGEYSFLAYYVHKDGEFFSGRITTPEMTVAPEKKPEPEKKKYKPKENIELNRPSQIEFPVTGKELSFFKSFELDEYSVSSLGGRAKINELLGGETAIEKMNNVNNFYAYLLKPENSGILGAWQNAVIGNTPAEKLANLKKFFDYWAAGEADLANSLIDPAGTLANSNPTTTNLFNSFSDINAMLKAFENSKNTLKLSFDFDIFKSPNALTKVYLVYHHINQKFYLAGENAEQTLSIDAGNVTVLQSFNLTPGEDIPENSLDPKNLDKFHAQLFGTAGLSFARIGTGKIFDFTPSDRTYWGFNTSIGTMLKWDLSDESAIRLITEAGWERFKDKQAAQVSDTYSIGVNLNYDINKSTSVGVNARFKHLQLLSDAKIFGTPISKEQGVSIQPGFTFSPIKNTKITIGPSFNFAKGYKPDWGFYGTLTFSPSLLFKGENYRAGFEHNERK